MSGGARGGVADASVEAHARRLLEALDTARLLTLPSAGDPAFDLATAYRVADAARAMRIARGERPRGYKIGFTNRGIWDRYGVHAPIWGPVWDSTVADLGPARSATLSLGAFSQPRLEPEIMFGFARSPRAGMSEAELAGCIDWVAHGVEIVHTHFADWRFTPADTVANFALHGRLLVGERVPIAAFADPAREFAALHVTLLRDDTVIDEGDATIVLGGPLTALRLWVDALAAQPQEWPILPGDIVTTGTITDAAPMRPGERYETRLSDSRLPGVVVSTEP